jgi:AraC-like DNA-binding protein
MKRVEPESTMSIVRHFLDQRSLNGEAQPSRPTHCHMYGAPYRPASEQTLKVLESSAHPMRCRIERVARQLGRSQRDLQRSLTADGTSFKKLRARFTLLLSDVLLVDAKLTNVDIAARLGFAHRVSFERFVKKHMGYPSGALRNRKGYEEIRHHSCDLLRSGLSFQAENPTLRRFKLLTATPLPITLHRYRRYFDRPFGHLTKNWCDRLPNETWTEKKLALRLGVTEAELRHAYTVEGTTLSTLLEEFREWQLLAAQMNAG